MDELPMDPYHRPHPMGATVMFLGVLGSFCCWLTAPIGLILGRKARREVREGMYQPSTLLTVGFYWSLVVTILWPLLLGLLFFWLTVANDVKPGEVLGAATDREIHRCLVEEGPSSARCDQLMQSYLD